MKLARAVLHPHRPGTVLLRRRFVLDEPTIARLDELRVGELWVEFPPLAFIGEHVSPEVHRLRGSTMELVGNAFERIGAGEADVDLHYSDYSSTIRDLCRAIIDDPRASICLEHLAEGEVSLARHSTEVAYLSLLLGLRLDGYIIDQRRRVSAHRAKDIVNLGLGALLHDIGLVGTHADAESGIVDADPDQPPEGHYDADGRFIAGLTATQRDWLEHPVRGYQQVRAALHPTASAIVLHHHQAYDGSGFPRWPAIQALRGPADAERPDAVHADDEDTPAPAGEDIHVFSRIVAVADAFDRVRHTPSPRIDGGAPIPIVAAQNALLHEPWSRRLDPVVLRALLAVVPAYGPGTLVRLSDGRSAAVTKSHPENPCRPTVHVLGDDWAELSIGHADESSMMLERIDLRRVPSLAIVEAEGRPTERFNFDLTPAFHQRGAA
ncbi:MAG: HD-GYP domain-containing protein [Phycisphaerales bacterium]